MKTIWGKADRVREIAPGIKWADTPSHGGVVLDDAHALKMRKSGYEPFAGNFHYWEEDCDWAAAFYVFWNEIPDHEKLPYADYMRLALKNRRQGPRYIGHFVIE